MGLYKLNIQKRIDILGTTGLLKENIKLIKRL